MEWKSTMRVWGEILTIISSPYNFLNVYRTFVYVNVVPIARVLILKDKVSIHAKTCWHRHFNFIGVWDVLRD